jgi:hypothetical protein
MNQALSYLDVVIACVAVLVMATSIVLTMTQLTLAGLNKRKEILTASLTKLLESIELTPAQAGTVAAAIVDDPKCKEQGGSVVKREQLVGMLLEKAGKSALDAELKTALKTALGLGAIDPEVMLKSLRVRILQIEAASPDLADHIRRTKAIVEKAVDGQAVMGGIVRIMSGFDRVCEEMTHAMRSKARFWTILFSAVVAIALPLDFIGIAKQLAKNPTEVQHLVETAKGLKKAGAPATKETEDNLAELQKQLKTQTAQITNPALGIRPFAVFTPGFWNPEATDHSPACPISFWLLRIAGILTSIALMSLGAPFWFDALKNLLALRPSLASKETGERAERATTKSI